MKLTQIFIMLKYMLPTEYGMNTINKLSPCTSDSKNIQAVEIIRLKTYT